MIVDREDNLYCGNRHGDIMRFFGPDYQARNIRPCRRPAARPRLRYAGNLDVCIGGMGLYQITPDRKSTNCRTRPTERCSRWSTISRLRLADDLDIAPDGRVLFQRGDDPFRDARMAGRCAGKPRQRPHRLLRTKNRKVAYGNVQPDLSQRHLHVAGRQSFFFAETFGCRVSRYY